MVGTVFVNFLSLALSTYSTLLAVQVETKKGKILELNGLKDKTQANIGSIQYGLSRNILVVHEDVSDGD